MSTPDERAARRRACWTAEVVKPGQPKDSLYASLTPAERLRAFARLNQRVWKVVARTSAAPLSRSEWPGEIFKLRRHG